MFGAILKARNSSFQKGMTFCPCIYVTKVMNLLAFIFEQPSYLTMHSAIGKLLYCFASVLAIIIIIIIPYRRTNQWTSLEKQLDSRVPLASPEGSVPITYTCISLY